MAESTYEIEPEALRDRIEGGESIQIVDVREPWELDVCRLPGTTDIPMAQLPETLDSLDKQVPVVTLCHHGGRSLQVAVWLRHQGFETAVSLKGGIHEWAARIDPQLAQY